MKEFKDKDENMGSHIQHSGILFWGCWCTRPRYSRCSTGSRVGTLFREGSYSICTTISSQKRERGSRVMRWGDPVMGQRMSHVLLNHLASPLDSPDPAICHFDSEFYYPFNVTCMSLKVRKCINPWELKCVLSSDGSKFLRMMSASPRVKMVRPGWHILQSVF